MRKSWNKLPLLGLMLATLTLSGCFWMAVGAGAGAAGVAYTMGEIRSTESHPLEQVYNAGEAALKGLKMEIRASKVDGLAGRIDAKTADGKDVTIRVERLAEESTELRVRVGPIPDEQRTRAIHDAIRAKL